MLQLKLKVPVTRIKWKSPAKKTWKINDKTNWTKFAESLDTKVEQTFSQDSTNIEKYGAIFQALTQTGSEEIGLRSAGRRARGFKISSESRMKMEERKRAFSAWHLAMNQGLVDAVSYTHLTLPTKA